MQALMHGVVLDEKAQRDWRLVADGAASVEPLFGDAIDYAREDLVLHFPPIQQSEPWLAGIAMRGDPGILRVLRPRIAAVRGGADKAAGGCLLLNRAGARQSACVSSRPRAMEWTRRLPELQTARSECCRAPRENAGLAVWAYRTPLAGWRWNLFLS